MIATVHNAIHVPGSCACCTWDFYCNHIVYYCTDITMKTGAGTPSSSPTVIQLLIIIIPSSFLLIVLLAPIPLLVWCRKRRGKMNLNENFTEQNTDVQVNEIPIAQVQRVNETESEALYSSINDNTSPTSCHNRTITGLKQFSTQQQGTNQMLQMDHTRFMIPSALQ